VDSWFRNENQDAPPSMIIVLFDFIDFTAMPNEVNDKF
jgi:hypothetical protein